MSASMFHAMMAGGVPSNSAYIYETDTDLRIRPARTYETDDDSINGYILIETI